ncbi:hypothetical protein VVT58_22965 (plasmid) [Sphingobium sp. SJ10-10]|uniref:Copper resistance protein D domain-containing protein n=1 Tax=Sphingomonas sp. NS2 TaxID=908605 RepID=A0A0D4ZYY1_9SPHN|nr:MULTISPECIES: hypothetical protein [unclassified Sphingobium]AJW29240.1 hypothetical protein plasmid201_052 [Sphingomonas sp. NS2]AMK26476.1 hypothetical protein K426_27885 [Sphingobium sp. TKS]MEC6699454.1 hypothetical protein [Sphingobium sp. SJ10-10]
MGDALARALHVLSIVVWIGGVAFVTLVVMPSIRRGYPPAERLAVFRRFEEHFAPQARIWVLIAGASGLWMVYRSQMWGRFIDPRFWWMHAMVCLWAIFALMLFVIEPLAHHHRTAGAVHPTRDFVRMERLHRIVLLLSVATIMGAAAGSHGLL